MKATLRGNTLIATMVTLVIILLLASAFMFGSGMFRKPGEAPVSSRPDGKGTTVPGAAEAAARDVVTRERLSQVRMAIELFKTNNDDQFPASLDDLKLPKEVLIDAVGKVPFVYDPATGTVTSPHLGHEKY